MKAGIDLQVQSDGNAMAGLRLALDQSISVCFYNNLNHLPGIFIDILNSSFERGRIVAKT